LREKYAAPKSIAVEYDDAPLGRACGRLWAPAKSREPAQLYAFAPSKRWDRHALGDDLVYACDHGTNKSHAGPATMASADNHDPRATKNSSPHAPNPVFIMAYALASTVFNRRRMMWFFPATL